MKKVKQILSVFLVITCICLMVGCGSGSGKQGNKLYGKGESFTLKDIELTPKCIIEEDDSCKIVFSSDGVDADNSGDFYMEIGEGDDAIECDSAEAGFQVGDDGKGDLVLWFTFDDVDSIPDVGTVAYGSIDSNEAVQVDLASLPRDNE